MKNRHIDYHLASVAIAVSFAATAGAVGAVGCSIFLPEYTYECAIGLALFTGVTSLLPDYL